MMKKKKKKKKKKENKRKTKKGRRIVCSDLPGAGAGARRGCRPIAPPSC